MRRGRRVAYMGDERQARRDEDAAERQEPSMRDGEIMRGQRVVCMGD